MNSAINRRKFLRASGVCVALPWLEGLSRGQSAASVAPRRMVCVCAPLGLHAENFFPKEPGRDYALTPYLEALKDFRENYTVISGLAHPEVGPTHDSIYSFLTAAPHPEVRAGFRNTISLDQFAAEQLRGVTRYPSLAAATEGFGLSWTRSGAPVPAEGSPARVFKRLFIAGTPTEVRAELNRIRDGRSILDMLTEQRAQLNRTLGPQDQGKLDEYFTGVRELERQLAQSEQWSAKPKPTVDAPLPQDVANPVDIVQQNQLWFDLFFRVLQTDSTRLITLMLGGISGVPAIEGVSYGYHDLSHHGQDAKKLEQLRTVELAQMATLRDFLKKLHNTQEGDATLLDRSMVFFSSSLGNASNHDVKNLPVLLAGGGFKHGQHLAFNPNDPPPLSNLFVSMLQRLGLEVDNFGSSTGTLTGLELS